MNNLTWDIGPQDPEIGLIVNTMSELIENMRSGQVWEQINVENYILSKYLHIMENPEKVNSGGVADIGIREAYWSNSDITEYYGNIGIAGVSKYMFPMKLIRNVDSKQSWDIPEFKIGDYVRIKSKHCWFNGVTCIYNERNLKNIAPNEGVVKLKIEPHSSKQISNYPKGKVDNLTNENVYLVGTDENASFLLESDLELI